MDHSTDECSFDELLPECKTHILQFLSLEDCLKFTATSKKSLVAALSQLGQRRRIQFYHRCCYQIDNPTFLKPSSTIWDPSIDEDTDGLFSSRLVNKDHWYTIPSVGEQILQLYRCIPASHPANNELRDLKADLVQNANLVIEEPLGFVEGFRQLLNCTRAHKLHASILSKSTVKCSPRRCQRYSNTARAYGGSNNGNNNPNSLSATLETYMGDVLVAVYLMGNEIANLVEGGPSFDDWNAHILALLGQARTNGNNQEALDWYQHWVYLHSALLRTFPLAISHAKILLGSSSLNGILGHSIPQNEQYVHPHYCYMGLAPRHIETTTKIVRSLLMSLANENSPGEMNTLRMAHQTTMNQFGPLGPAFRGRDEIRTRVMNPFSLLHRLHHPEYALLPTTWFFNQDEGQQEHVILDSRTFHNWFRGTDAVIRWMLELKEECSKSRPMTVMPPVITVEPIAISAFLMDHAIE